MTSPTIAGLQEAMKALIKIVDRHETEIGGNGQPGIVERLIRIEESLKPVLKFIEDQEDSRTFWSRTVWVMIFTNIVALIIAFVT